jgi:hypothetical protein
MKNEKDNLSSNIIINGEFRDHRDIRKFIAYIYLKNTRCRTQDCSIQSVLESM